MKTISKKWFINTTLVLFILTQILAPSLTANTIVSKPTNNQYAYGSLSGYVNDTHMNPISGARVRVSYHNTYQQSECKVVDYTPTKYKER